VTGRARPVPGASCSRWLVHALVAGGDCIDDVELLRCGSTASMLGHQVMAPSTVGTWLRSFTLGHVQQLDKVTGEILSRAWAAGAGPDDGPLMVDVDSTICEVHGYHKQGACYGYTHRLGYHPLLATRADSGEVLHARLRKGTANTARGILRFCDELIARLRRAGASGELTFRMDSGFWSAKLIKRSGGSATWMTSSSCSRPGRANRSPDRASGPPRDPARPGSARRVRCASGATGWRRGRRRRPGRRGCRAR
jgi:Transposase DDE domain group 1